MRTTRTITSEIKEFISTLNFTLIEYKRGKAFQNISNYKLTLEKENKKVFIKLLTTPELILTQLKKELI